MDKEAKKMTYAIEPLVKLLRSEAISDGGTRKKAEELEGTWIRLNETMFVFVEADKVTLVFRGGTEVGCACQAFSDPSMNVLCEHIIAFEDLKSPPQLSIEAQELNWLKEYLFSLGWYAENRYLYPSLDAELPRDEDSWKPDEDESKKVDPVNEDKDLDIGVDDGPAVGEPPESVKTIERKCDWCGHVEKGEDRDQVIAAIAEHRKICPKNPANKKKEAPKKPSAKETVAPEKPKEDKKVAPPSKKKKVKPPSKKKKVKPPSKNAVSLYDWVENIIEFGVGQVFGESGDGKTALCRELAIQAADEGKKVVYWDTEGNMTRKQRAVMMDHDNIEYILDRDWEEIRHMLPVTGEDDRTGPSIYAKTPKLKKCDLFILDSIGVPVLGIFGDMKQNEKGSALQGMQGLVYRLTAWAEKNEAVVIVTNQPVSEMGKTKSQIADRPPFGDKMKYFTKEILKMVTARRTDYSTVCNLLTWRTRDDKRGKVIATVTISDNGVEVTPTESG